MSFQTFLDEQPDATRDLVKLAYQLGVQRALVEISLLRDQSQTGTERWLALQAAWEAVEANL